MYPSDIHGRYPGEEINPQGDLEFGINNVLIGKGEGSVKSLHCF